MGSRFLYLYSCDNIADVGLKDISEGLKRLVGLKTLNLDFERYVLLGVLKLICRCSRITDVGLESLSGGLKGLRTLKRINLNFLQ